MKGSPTSTKPASTKSHSASLAEADSGEVQIEERAAGTGHSSLATRHRRYGWTALLVFISFGATLEGLLGFKSIALLFDPLRRELWSLAHFHGAMLAIVNLVYVSWADRVELSQSQQQAASWALILGSLAMPAGFFFGGIAHPEGDPSLAIFLVPLGALLLAYAAGLQTIAAWKGKS